MAAVIVDLVPPHPVKLKKETNIPLIFWTYYMRMKLRCFCWLDIILLYK
jgi:hypothetical protein